MPFLDEIAARLVTQGVGVLGSSIFLGSGANIPAGDGPYMTIIETGGTAPSRIHNITSASTQRPTAQIAVRAKSYAVARTMVKAAYTALDGVRNTTIDGTFYQSISARQEPTDIGLEPGTNRRMLVFNIDAQKQPS